MARVVPYPSEKAGIQQSAIPALLRLDYGALALDEDSEELQDRLSEGELARAATSGVVIRRAVVVEVATTGDYILYLRLSDRLGYVSIAKRRPKDGPKGWSDFRTLHRTLQRQGYRGAVCIFPEGHPVLLRHGIGVDPPA